MQLNARYVSPLIYIYIYNFLEFIVINISLAGLAVDQMWYKLESAQYLR